jgi:hypothetical protein
MKMIKVIAACFVFFALLSFTQLMAQYDNSPSEKIVITEAVWAPATGGGTWMTTLQLTCHSAGTGGLVDVYFNYNSSGDWRGPVTFMTDPGAHESAYSSNILSYMQSQDPSFTYYGRSGSLTIYADTGISIIGVARVYNGNYSKTVPGLNDVDSNSVTSTRVMAVPGLASNYLYRSTLGLANPYTGSITVDIYVVDWDGYYQGSIITRTIPGYGFIAINPFVACGRPYPTYYYNYTNIEIWPVSGTGRVLVFGASTNNYTNDSGAHIGVNWQTVTPDAYNNKPRR